MAAVKWRLAGGARELLADAAAGDDPSWWLSGPPPLPNCRENPLWDDGAAEPAAPIDTTQEVRAAARARLMKSLAVRSSFITCVCCLSPQATQMLVTLAG